MDDPKPLTEDQAREVVMHLRVGRTATEAARFIHVKPARVYAAARTNTDLLLALAGHDPYAQDSATILQQADYLRLLAIGLRPGEAERVLWHGSERVKKWRTESRLFGEVADFVRRLRPPELGRRREHRFNAYRVSLFLSALRDGLPVVRAAEEAGITNAVVYQRRRRDATFRDLMDAARKEAGAVTPRPRQPVPEDRWKVFRATLEHGATLRKAALVAGIEPTTVYKRRIRDAAFREDTNRLRGMPRRYR